MKIKKIGVLTSGGDAPGMNACLRAVVRTAIYNKLEVIGIRRGYIGMINRKFTPLNLRSVSNIIQRGGTAIETGRSKEFTTKAGRSKAARNIRQENIDAIIAIGGDGTFRGAHKFYQEHRIPIIGLPGTIDNDIYGTDETIGFDTAINTAMEAVDKIRDTAAAHERVFLIEVMGREAGFIGLDVGIASGAEEILIPETKTDTKAIFKRLIEGKKKGKSSSIIVVSEGDDVGGAIALGKKIKQKHNLNFRVSILGYIQRGGHPTVKDRVLASKLGYESIIALLKGKKDIMVGEIDNKIKYTSLKHTWTKKKHIDKRLLSINQVLAC